MNNAARVTDEDGYLLVNRVFEKKGFKYEWIEDYDDGWCAYSQTMLKNGAKVAIELVKFNKSEEYIIAGISMPKKWNYPPASVFGVTGFTLKSLDAARQRYQKLLTEKSETAPESQIPGEPVKKRRGRPKKIKI